MDNTVIAAIIGAIGGVVSATIPLVLTPILKSKAYRSHNKIPDILGSWKNEWYIGDRLYTEDMFKIEKWSKKNHFEGTGYDPKSQYRLSGEVDVSRIVVGSYIDSKYPTLGYIGTFIMELSVDGKVMEGYWHGRTPNGDIEGGRVHCKRQ